MKIVETPSAAVGKKLCSTKVHVRFFRNSKERKGLSKVRRHRKNGQKAEMEYRQSIKRILRNVVKNSIKLHNSRSEDFNNENIITVVNIKYRLRRNGRLFVGNKRFKFVKNSF